MKEIALNRSEEYKAKLREHLAKLNGRKMPSEIRAKITAGLIKFNVDTKGKRILVTNINKKKQ